MLVLLIIFMVTTPLIAQGVKVDLPKQKAMPLEVKEEKLVLSIDAERRVYIGDTEVPLQDLEAKLQANARVQKDREVFLHADRSLPYGVVVEVMAIARRAGVEGLGMITEPEKERR
jgi:biopolymer transport protein TolR